MEQDYMLHNRHLLPLGPIQCEARMQARGSARGSQRTRSASSDRARSRHARAAAELRERWAELANRAAQERCGPMAAVRMELHLSGFGSMVEHLKSNKAHTRTAAAAPTASSATDE